MDILYFPFLWGQIALKRETEVTAAHWGEYISMFFGKIHTVQTPPIMSGRHQEQARVPQPTESLYNQYQRIENPNGTEVIAEIHCHKSIFQVPQ